MEKLNTDIMLLIVTGVMAMCMLATFLIIFVLLHRKKVLALENKLKEKEIQHQRELLEAAIKSEAKERERLARNLHDDLGSLLNVMKINCFRLKQHIHHPDQVLPIVQENENIVKMTIETTRNLIRELSNHALIGSDFITHLQQLCDHISRSGALSVEIHSQQNEIFLPADIQQQLSRIVKELINNIMKHAHASSLHIHLKHENALLHLLLYHNGEGLNNDDIPRIYARNKGLGLKNIESRIQSLKAKINYFYDGKSESKITIECPIEEREKDSHSHSR